MDEIAIFSFHLWYIRPHLGSLTDVKTHVNLLIETTPVPY